MEEGALISVGERIRTLRKKRGLTLQKFSEQVGVSTSYLSQIENARANTNLNILQRIASALQVPLVDLFSDENSFQVSVVRKEDRRVYPLDCAGTEHLLFSQTRTALQVAVIELPPRCAIPQADSHPGEEFTYVLSGKLRMRLGDDLLYELETGDIIYYRSVLPHRWENTGDAPLRVLVANTPATF